ncbi:L-ascorbate peroxidase 1, cytosolic [Cymbomonas tetramitiformis]|uniref:L-ascorbate peroxidase 1, cytosolic n=1 Tax=Cymbomonas tetramitiformis TaxID=36881 RepID=A0AAE0LBZ8_9CHLO|nr:L-ascorbate peroxidase 1, cytosolic [Cymbomonas tetramitiformis]
MNALKTCAPAKLQATVKQRTVFQGKAIGKVQRQTERNTSARVCKAASEGEVAHNREDHTLTVSRRSLFPGVAFIAAAGFVVPSEARAAEVDFSAVRADIVEIIKADPDKGPTLVRLAWHSSGTYDKMTNTGGSGAGTIRFKEELAHGANAGLDTAVGWMEPIKAKHEALSYADLYTLAGAVAVEELGGPAVGWRAGRMDAIDPSEVTPDGRLPAADKGNPMATAQGLRDTFYRMGFNDQEIVALAGAHALGRCHADASGYVGPWTGTPTIFTNAYFTLLLKLKWTPDDSKALFQYTDTSGQLMMLPSDIVLIEDDGFKGWVQIYSKDNKKFYSDFAAAFQKLEELGTSNLYSV